MTLTRGTVFRGWDKVGSAFTVVWFALLTHGDTRNSDKVMSIVPMDPVNTSTLLLHTPSRLVYELQEVDL